MSTQTNKKSPWLKKILLGGLVLVLAGAGIYWYIATDTFSDTKDRKSAFTVEAVDFIREFQQNDSLANLKYREKIITVNGTVSDLESPDTATVNVKLVDTASGSFAIFAFQDQHVEEAKSLKIGDKVSIKGSCSGGSLDGILEVIKIDFKRSALNK